MAFLFVFWGLFVGLRLFLVLFFAFFAWCSTLLCVTFNVAVGGVWVCCEGGRFLCTTDRM